MAQRVLREFLLAIERPKQSLDAHLQSLADALAEHPTEISALWCDIQPQCEPLMHIWPETIGATTKWETRDAIATFLRVFGTFVKQLTVQKPAMAEKVALQLLREKNSQWEKWLSWSDKPRIEYETLAFLTTLIQVNDVVAREFVRLFPFQTPTFQKMATRRMKVIEENKDAPSYQVREAYVRLVLALTTSKDKNVHRFALKESGLAVSLFKSLDGDSIDMLSLVFTTLLTHVLRNDDMEIKAKRVVLNVHCIQQLVALLRHDDGAIAQLALDILRELFLDQHALYAIEKNKDDHQTMKLIRQTVVSIGLNDVLNSAPAQTLVMQLMERYPVLLSEYFHSLALQLEPKPSFRWFCIVSLLQKLLNTSLDTHDFTNEASIASRFILPLTHRKELSKALQHPNQLIVYSILGLLQVVLQRFQCIANQLNAAQLQEMETDLRSLVPSVEVLVSLLMKLAASKSFGGSVPLVYARALSVYRLYHECLPQVMHEVKVDATKLIAWHVISSSSDISGGLYALIVCETLQLLLVLEPQRLRLLLNKSQSKLGLLLALYTSSSTSSIRSLCFQVLKRLLLISKVFGAEQLNELVVKREVQMWLHALCQSQSIECAEFVERVVEEVLNDPFRFVSRDAGVSPATLALLSFLNHSNGDSEPFAASSLRSYRENRPVIAFAVRILLKTMVTLENTKALLQLIAHEPQSEPTASRKRRLSHENLYENDPFVWFQRFSTAVLHPEARMSRPSAQKKVKKQKKSAQDAVALMECSPAEVLHQLETSGEDTKALVVFGESFVGFNFVQKASKAFVNTAPLSFVAQSTVLTALVDQEHQTSLIQSFETIVNERLQGSSELNPDDIQLVCEQVIFALSQSTATASTLATVLHRLLIALMQLDDNSQSIVTLIKRLERVTFASNDENVIKKIKATALCMRKWLQTSDSCEVAMVPWVCLLPQSFSPTAHLAMVKRLLSLSSRKVSSVLTKHAIKSMGKMDFTIQPKPSVSSKLWNFVNKVSCDDVAFVIACLRVIRWNGGIPIEGLQPNRVVSLVLQSKNPTQVLRSMLLALPSSMDSDFINQLQQLLLISSPQNDQQAVVLAVCQVFTSIPETKLIESVVHNAIHHVFSSKDDIIAMEILRVMTDKQLIGPLLPFIANECTKSSKLSANQVLCILLAWRQETQQPEEPDAETLVGLIAFLMRGSLQLLLQPKDFNPFIVHTARVLVIDMLRHVGNDRLVEQFIQDGSILRSFDRLLERTVPENAFDGFVDVSVMLLGCLDRLQLPPSQYDPAAHLDAIVSRTSFSIDQKNAQVLQVLYRLVQRSRQFDSALFQKLLSSYNMSMTCSDRLIRLILEVFETSSGSETPANTLAYYGFRFGSSALEENEEATKTKRSDLVQDAGWLLSGGLDSQRLRLTIEQFPLDREVAALESDRALTAFDYDVQEEEVPAEAIQAYDPSYLLPMLSYFLSSSSQLSESALIQQGLLGLAIRATSSDAESMREHAYGTIAHCFETLSAESAELKAGRQIHLLLQVFRQAIQEPLEIIPSVLTVFLNDAISILCRPKHSLYVLINHFLLARPAMDLADVPMFYALFNSKSTMTFKQERAWLLHTLRRGIRDDDDVHLLLRRHVLSILSSFYSSELSDDHTQQLIGQVLTAVLKTESGAMHLLQKAAFLEWLATNLLANASTSGFQTLVELFQASLESVAFEPTTTSAAQQKALSVQASTVFSAICRLTNQQPALIAQHSSLLSNVAALVLARASSGCSLVIYERAVQWLPGANHENTQSALKNLLSPSILRHPEFFIRHFDRWSVVFSQGMKHLKQSPHSVAIVHQFQTNVLTLVPSLRHQLLQTQDAEDLHALLLCN